MLETPQLGDVQFPKSTDGSCSQHLKLHFMTQSYQRGDQRPCDGRAKYQIVWAYAQKHADFALGKRF